MIIVTIFLTEAIVSVRHLGCTQSVEWPDRPTDSTDR